MGNEGDDMNGNDMNGNDMNGSDVRTAFRTCPLCEATCGVTITLDGDTPLAAPGYALQVQPTPIVCGGRW